MFVNVDLYILGGCVHLHVPVTLLDKSLETLDLMWMDR